MGPLKDEVDINLCPYQGRVERSVGRHRGGHAALLSVDAAAAHGSAWWVQGAGGG